MKEWNEHGTYYILGVMGATMGIHWSFIFPYQLADSIEFVQLSKRHRA